MKAYAMTDIGAKRTTNQDCVYMCDGPIGKLPNLFIVADGMGGHKAGEVASNTAVDTIVWSVKNSKKKDVISVFEDAIDKANKELIAKSKSAPEFNGMGTTVVVATVTDKTVYVANVGDSRLYFVNDSILQITRDHSYVEEMVSIGEIDKNDARNHEKKNIITRAVGIDEDLTADFFEVQYAPSSKVLMCSDGLSNMVEDEAIKDIVNGLEDTKSKVTKLIDTANLNGGKDNIAVVLIEI